MNTPFLIFYALFFALGASIGSFLNVVIWRLPYRGTEVTYKKKTGPLTLSWPPSHCPNCSHAIAWYENVPVVAWLVLRGRCAGCRTPISIRYPLVELALGLLYAALFLAYFVGHWNPAITDFNLDWPILLLHMFFVSAVLAASAIDADWYIIPPEIPWLVCGIGIIAVVFINRPGLTTVDPRGQFALPAIGASVGLVISLILTYFKIIPRSFENVTEASPPPEPKKEESVSTGYHAGITPPPKLTRQWPAILCTLVLLAIVGGFWILGSAHVASIIAACAAIVLLLGILPRDASTPDVTDEVLQEISSGNIRKEMITELAFLCFPVMGAIIASMLPIVLPTAADAPWLARLLGAVLGFLVGGGMLWLTRIVFSLLFGKEAMGLGDIHLMCAIGVILGAPLCVLTFFVFAPALGLLWAVVLISMRKPNILPYGPWLSVGAILALFFGQPLLTWYLRAFS